MSDYRLSNTAPVFSAGTGTLSCTAGTINVTGVGTLFSTELEVGDILKVGAVYLAILIITDDTHLTLQVAPVANISGAAFTYTTLPLVDGFSTPAEILVSEPVRWQEVRDTGDGLARGLGRPSTTWTWTNIGSTLFGALQSICSSKSVRVYVRTVNDVRLGTYRTYEAALIWPDDEGKYGQNNTMAFRLEFRDMVLL